MRVPFSVVVLFGIDAPSRALALALYNNTTSIPKQTVQSPAALAAALAANDLNAVIFANFNFLMADWAQFFATEAFQKRVLGMDTSPPAPVDPNETPNVVPPTGSGHFVWPVILAGTTEDSLIELRRAILEFENVEGIFDEFYGYARIERATRYATPAEVTAYDAIIVST